MGCWTCAAWCSIVAFSMIVWGHRMKITRLLAILAISTTLGLVSIGGGEAQAQNVDRQPAEFPPASYKGKQYVDSKGCVFIRAGIDGNVSWVPRMTRARKAVCGFQPSLGSRVASAPAAAAPTPRSQPTEITVNAAPAATTPPQRPAPQRATAARKPAPVVVRQTAPRPTPAPKPKVVAKPTKPTIAQPPVRVAREAVTSCPGASAISQRYLRGSSGLPVRCGPQAAPIVGTRVAGAPVPTAPKAQGKAIVQRPAAGATTATATVTSTTRIAPKHVVTNRANTQNVAVPHGYKKVWEDGRLNSKRAEQNLQGRADMLLVWTQTVPRRLINQHTGRDVTATVPLIYPYTNLERQRRELGQVTLVRRDGQLVKRIVRNSHAKAAPATRTPVYSSRSAPAAKQPSAVTQPDRAAVQGKRFVQIGTYRNPANAQAAARQVARMGMPARIGKHRKGGSTYLTVQAGPFDRTQSAAAAMQKLRAAGYKDAFARN